MSEYNRCRLALWTWSAIGWFAVALAFTFHANRWAVFCFALLALIAGTGEGRAREEWRYRHIKQFLEEQAGTFDSPYRLTQSGHVYPRGGRHPCGERDCPANTAKPNSDFTISPSEASDEALNG